MIGGDCCTGGVETLFAIFGSTEAGFRLCTCACGVICGLAIAGIVGVVVLTSVRGDVCGIGETAFLSFEIEVGG